MPGSPIRPMYGVRDAKRARATTLAARKSKRRTTKKMNIGYCIGWSFPPMLRNTMFYNNLNYLVLTAGAWNTYKLRCNSLHDPDASASATQPLYFSQLSTIYDHYTVISARIEIEYVSSVSGSTNLTVILYQDDDTTAATSVAQAINMPGVKSQLTNSAVAQSRKMYAGWSAATTFGNPTPWTDPELQGGPSVDPVEQSVWVVGAADSLGATQTLAFNCKITYEVMWDELRTYPL